MNVKKEGEESSLDKMIRIMSLGIKNIHGVFVYVIFITKIIKQHGNPIGTLYELTRNIV